jgi:cyclin B
MKTLEPQYKIDHEYLSKVQTEIKDTSRAFLVEWIIDVHRKFRLMSETLYVTINIVDRYLSIQPIKKSELHLLGVTALLIATKYEEIYPPELKDLLQVSENKFEKKDVLKMENKILATLDFDFMYPSSLRFLERFRKLSTTASDDQIFYFA